MGDKVWLTKKDSSTLQGPYLVASMPKSGRYTLCHENGTAAENGADFEERLLDFVD